MLLQFGDQQPYPSSLLVLAEISAPAAISNSTATAWPWPAATISAVDLQHSWLQHPTACSRFVSVLPVVGLGGDVGAGRDEQLDHARVSMKCCKHECSPPATELASASDSMSAIALGAWPYPSSSLAATSAPAAMSSSIRRECPPPAASMSAVRPRLGKIH